MSSRISRICIQVREKTTQQQQKNHIPRQSLGITPGVPQSSRWLHHHMPSPLRVRVFSPLLCFIRTFVVGLPTAKTLFPNEITFTGSRGHGYTFLVATIQPSPRPKNLSLSWSGLVAISLLSIVLYSTHCACHCHTSVPLLFMNIEFLSFSPAFSVGPGLSGERNFLPLGNPPAADGGLLPPPREFLSSVCCGSSPPWHHVEWRLELMFFIFLTAPGTLVEMEIFVDDDNYLDNGVSLSTMIKIKANSDQVAMATFWL